jgi:hypothetical protein
MGCPAGTWRTNSISFRHIAISGAGGMLTISPTGAFDMNYRLPVSALGSGRLNFVPLTRTARWVGYSRDYLPCRPPPAAGHRGHPAEGPAHARKRFVDKSLCGVDNDASMQVTGHVVSPPFPPGYNGQLRPPRRAFSPVRAGASWDSVGSPTEANCRRAR